MFSYVRLCVKVDLEKGLLEAIQLTMDNWKNIQPVNYEQLPFKCKQCHEYGHFTKYCPENIPPEQGQQDKND
jgi:Pyruvate/2-oxoacid:ferredoxin oxidoreductase delta subunit